MLLLSVNLITYLSIAFVNNALVKCRLFCGLVYVIKEISSVPQNKCLHGVTEVFSRVAGHCKCDIKVSANCVDDGNVRGSRYAL